MTMKTQIKSAAGLMAAIAVAGIVMLWTWVAHGQPASAPASQIVVPVPASATWTWIAANSGWIVPLAGNVLASIAVALKRFPKASGVVRVLWLIFGWFSSVEFRDGKKPGIAFKIPLTMPSPPPEPSAAPKVTA